MYFACASIIGLLTFEAEALLLMKVGNHS